MIRAEAQQLLRKQDKRVWNPITLVGCVIGPTALFAYVSFCLAFRLRFRQPYLAIALGPILGALVCLSATRFASKRARLDESSREPITLATCLWAALVLATLAGDANHWWHMFGYYTYQELASYTNIDPNQDQGQTYMDSGEMYFKESTYVLRNKAIALENAGLYCVAPIVRWPLLDPDGVDNTRIRRAGCPSGCDAPTCAAGDHSNGGRALAELPGGAGTKVCQHHCSRLFRGSRFCGIGAEYTRGESIDCSACAQALAPPPKENTAKMAPSASGTVDFWAVGKDCCEPSGANFRCGAVENPRARAGLRMLRDDLRPFYSMAVQEWSAWVGLPARHPLFFHWVEDPLAEVDRYFDEGVSTYGMFVTIFAGFDTALAFGLLYILLAAGFS